MLPPARCGVREQSIPPDTILIHASLAATGEGEYTTPIELTGDSTRTNYRMSTTDLVHGPLHLMILKTLLWGPMHGYAIARWIRHVTDDVLQIEEGSLYPALHRMEKRGWIAADWGLSENNRRAKFYHLTEDGRAHLSAESPNWLRFAKAVGTVLQTTEQPTF